ncbi:MAG: response regulator [Bacteroidetes bacterium]|nr:response regulator [Bacteroidota bacterium]MBI3482476.1 response regulator [Bacteroidota bacterium]
MPDFEALNFLVVEDDPVTQFLTKQMLEVEHLQHTCVDSGEKAIEALKTKKFHCVLMDIVMPGEDGMNTVRWIRDSEDEYFKKLPIFALTSFSSEEHTKEIMEAGLNGHLVKPLDVAVLKKLYTEYLASQVRS